MNLTDEKEATSISIDAMYDYYVETNRDAHIIAKIGRKDLVWNIEGAEWHRSKKYFLFRKILKVQNTEKSRPLLCILRIGCSKCRF